MEPDGKLKPLASQNLLTVEAHVVSFLLNSLHAKDCHRSTRADSSR
jgi:hypothetical protein